MAAGVLSDDECSRLIHEAMPLRRVTEPEPIARAVTLRRCPGEGGAPSIAGGSPPSRIEIIDGHFPASSRILEKVDMKLLKKKTRKAIRKIVRKAINKHGPEIAGHIATGSLAGLAALLAAEPKKGKKLKNKLVHAVRDNPAVEAITDKLPGGDANEKEKENTPKSRTDG